MFFIRVVTALALSRVGGHLMGFIKGRVGGFVQGGGVGVGVTVVVRFLG